ncbi:MAG: DUF99 family protein [Gammaproteobacteria bacterium]
MRRLSHLIGFDDAPFARGHRGNVLLVGAVYAGLRLEGVLSTTVRRDGVNATAKLARLVQSSRFASQVQGVLLQGIAFAGFNVVDLHRLHQQLRIPIVAVARKPPNWQAIRRALLTQVPGGVRKWRLIERLGPMEPVAGVFVQRVGVSLEDVAAVFQRLAVNSALPEPLRTAHLIAGGIVLGESRHRV